MKTIVINNQKGGVGKTMLAAHLAWFLAEDDPTSRILVIDFDPQGNVSHTLSEHGNGAKASQLLFGPDLALESRPGISLLAADPALFAAEQQAEAAMVSIEKRFPELKAHFDFVVIDTPPTWGVRNMAAMMVADALVSPIELEEYALLGVRALLNQRRHVESKARNGRALHFLGLLPSRFQSNSPKQRQHLQDLIKGVGSNMMFPGVITQRQGYSEALSEKVPVWKIKKTAAQEAGREIRPILSVIKQRTLALSEAAA